MLAAILAGALLITAAICWAGQAVAAALRASRVDPTTDRALHLFQIFTPAITAAERDPRLLLTWQPLARSARQLFPQEFTLLDGAVGGNFPFGTTHMQAAHARWTTEWLAWERTHDAEYKLKAAAAEEEVVRTGSKSARAHFDAIEREKLDLYQRRYEEYVRVSKALQGLMS